MKTSYYGISRAGLILLAILVISTGAFAQKSNKAAHTAKVIKEKAGRPDIPGDFLIEFGFNWLQEQPSGYGFNTLKSRTFNAYYLWEVPFGESAFSFHPGIGIGTEKYAFEDDITIAWGTDSLGNDALMFTPLDSIYGTGNSYKKSQINTNYLDIPIEFRWISRKYDPKRSFKISIGGKVGVLIDSKTKVKYTQNGENKKRKQKEKFNLNTLRYGVYMKIGYGGISAYGYYSLSDVFQKDEGPMATTMYPFTFGLSWTLF